MKLDTLELEVRRHANGLEFYDFIISGQSLYDLMRNSHPTCLWARSTDATAIAIGELLLEKSSALGDPRVPLFICEECGDPYCGGRSVQVSRTGEGVKWSNFEDFSLNVDDDNDGDFLFNPIGRFEGLEFTFEETQYRTRFAAVAMGRGT